MLNSEFQLMKISQNRPLVEPEQPADKEVLRLNRQIDRADPKCSVRYWLEVKLSYSSPEDRRVEEGDFISRTLKPNDLV